MWFALLLFFNLFSSGEPTCKKEEIVGRSGQPLYTLDVPLKWERIKVPVTDDSKEPIAAFSIDQIKFLIHNFPGMRIPPQAQIERWKRQSRERFVEPASFSGFQGLLLENDTVLAWALEWAACKRDEKEQFSDLTIKVTGPKEEMENHREDIIKAARSLELIEDLCRW